MKNFEIDGIPAFALDNLSVINIAGENYYKACGAFVSHTDDDVRSSCIKPVGHRTEQHEDSEGRTYDIWHINLESMTIEGAIFCALNLATTCERESERMEYIRKQLTKRIRDSGPIYD